MGKKDGDKYYANYTGAATGTLITTILFGIVGLIPAIATSATAPKEINLEAPKAELMKNADYRTGYTQAARKKKSGKVWSNFGVGCVLSVALTLILSY